MSRSRFSAPLRTARVQTAVCFALGAAVLSFGPPTGSLAGEAPPLKGQFADNFSLSDPPMPAPGDAMTDGNGNPVTVQDFAGQVVLLNFWATWCAPCVREMPSLDRLQAALGDQGLAVVAVSRDRGGRNVVEKFYDRLALEHLEIYLDRKGSFSRAFGVRGLPTTVLIDGRGRLIGELRGDAEWDGEDAVALIHHYLKALDAPPEVEKLDTSG